jgi:hypothetical protein
MNLRREVLAHTRACEQLLSVDLKLSDDERSLLEYYLNELSREFLPEKPIVRVLNTDSSQPVSSA